MRNFEARARTLKTALLVITASFLLASPAWAASGEGSLDKKNSDAMTLVVDDVVIFVTEDTRLYDRENKRISFQQIAEPRVAASTVEYTGRRSREGIVATKLVVYITPQ